ncbi:MAG: hypothetical protein HQ564_00170 [Candidatus Saganbacteria bacterium]|nr:hypothetical protein [Candidatus Saganbacteria bacterium]
MISFIEKESFGWCDDFGSGNSTPACWTGVSVNNGACAYGNFNTGPTCGNGGNPLTPAPCTTGFEDTGINCDSGTGY